MNFLFLASNYYYDKPGIKTIEAMIETSIKEGVDLEHLVEISYGLSNNISKNQLIKVFFKENNLKFPSHYDAGMYLIKYYSEMVLSGHLTPYEGAKKIWLYVYCNEECDREFDSLKWLSGLVSEYEDFSEEPQIEFYGSEKCKELKKDTEVKIVEEIKSLLHQRG